MDNRKDGALISVRVTPGSRRNSITALKEGVWYVKVAAPPVEGKANEELVVFLSRVLGLRKNGISVVKGQTSRNKLVSILGLGQKEVMLRLSAGLDG
jgi:uncharacterized protein (TIGR00251 family)